MGSLEVKDTIALVGTLCFLVIVLSFVVLSYVLSKKEITKDLYFLGIKFLSVLIFITVVMMAQGSEEIIVAAKDLMNLVNHGPNNSPKLPEETKFEGKQGSEKPITTGSPNGSPKPPEEINFEGKYVYKSEPNKEQIDKPALLIGEDRKEYYQFIGTVEISKDANTGSISVCGLRQFSVSLDSDKNVIINETDVHWRVDRTRAFLPQGGESELIWL